MQDQAQQSAPPATSPALPAQSTQSTQSPQSLQLPTTRPVLTMILLVLIIVFFAATFIVDQTLDPGQPNPILEFGVLDYRSILLNGEVYRLFTAIFLHLSPAHIFFNAYALWIFGRTVEGLFGHIRFALIYFVGGLSGSLMSFAIGRGASAGASGAIFAIMAAEVVFLYRHRDLLGARAGAALRELLILGGLNLGLGLLSNIGAVRGGGIDNWGHIGGFIGGLLMALLIAPQFVVTRTKAKTLAVVDEKPLSLRWPFAVFGVLVLALLIGWAVATLPR